ncbi:hypothetical protein [Psychrosphaera haliotis]|uniref:hypothetical protein n=1 Tax=Psychrosphaera haliotis TaxID=555083 RepID=UPI0031D1AD4F
MKKKKGLWQKSPELLTCPHCEKRFKLKQVLIDHIQKCSAKKTESNTKGVTNKVIGNGFSYEWASKQKLDKKFEGVMSKLALEKDIEYLSKEINSLVARLNTDPNDSKAQNRLILVAKAKKSILKKQKKTKSNNKKKGKQNSNLKTDAMDYRVPGSWGAGKNR